MLAINNIFFTTQGYRHTNKDKKSVVPSKILKASFRALSRENNIKKPLNFLDLFVDLPIQEFNSTIGLVLKYFN